MTYLSLSLKIVLCDWKVESFNEVVGQREAEDKLEACHVSGKVALIFEGAEFG